MTRGESSHFLAGDRVSNQRHASETQRIDRGANVVDEAPGVIVVRRMIGLSEPTSCECDHTELIDERRREIVERMRGVAESGEKQQRGAASAEVQIVEVYAAIDTNFPRCVAGRVAPTVGRRPRSLRDGPLGRHEADDYR